MERGLTSALIDKRNVGVMIHENLTEQRLSTGALGLFRDSNGDLETTDGWGVTGRATVVPVYEH